MYHQGKFKPKNPSKYKGDFTNIFYRSSWELQVMARLDKDPNVLEWASEEIQIAYRSPADNQVHRYFPDFYVKLRDKSGQIIIQIIEIKPYKETVPPIQGKKRKKTFINEVITYGINQEKWKAAKALCYQRGWKFVVLTENELGLL